MLEERKRTRAYNKEMKVQAEAQKKRQKEIDLAEKLTDRQLQNDLKQAQERSKKDKRTVLQGGKDLVSDVVRVEAGSASSQVNRRGRKIQKPQRFQE